MITVTEMSAVVVLVLIDHYLSYDIHCITIRQWIMKQKIEIQLFCYDRSYDL